MAPALDPLPSAALARYTGRSPLRAAPGRQAAVTQRIEGAYPADETLPPLRESAVLAMSLHFEGRMGPDEPEVSIRTDAIRRMNWRITPR